MTYEEWEKTNSCVYKGFLINFGGFYNVKDIYECMIVFHKLGTPFEAVIERTKPMIDKYIAEAK